MKHNKLHDVLLAAPGYLIYTVFMIIPLGLCLFYSFTNWDGISKNYKMIGFKNFVRLFQDASFYNALKVTLIITVITVLCVIAAVIMAKSINAYQMGEQYASSVGVNVKVFRVLLVLVSSLLSATVTAFAGPVSFVGIAVPHLIRTVLHTADPKKIIPGCLLGGGLFCLVCDFLARTYSSEPGYFNVAK